MYIHIFMHPNPSFIIKLIRIRPQQRSFPEMVAGLAFQVYGLMKGKDRKERVYSDLVLVVKRVLSGSLFTFIRIKPDIR